MEVGALDHGKGDEGNASACRAVQKDWGEGDGCVAHQTFRGRPTNSGQPGLVPGPTTGAFPGGYHQLYGGRGGGETLRRGWAWWDGLSQSPTLATTFQGGERGATADCHGLHRVAEK